MSLVANAIDALFNGVSQQPAAMRLPSQCEAQVNGYSSVADGLTKRPPSQYLSKLSASTFSDPFIHIINRDTTERYAVIITDEAIAVHDLADGTSQTVTFETSAAWAAATAYSLGDIVRPSSANGFVFRCTTAGTSHATTEPTWDAVEDNTTADNSVTWTAVQNYFAIPAAAKASESFEVVTVADYSFIVNKTITVRTQTMPTATPGRHANWYFPKNWTKKSDGTRYYTASFGTNKGSKQTLQDLPNDEDTTPPVEGDFYTIKGNSDTGFSQYYVIRRSGVWQETHAYNGAVAIDEATMPHALIRESDNNFHVREFGWVPRLFGDGNNNPNPTFVDKTINSLGYHKNRLVMAAGENIIFSGAGDYGNFYRNTVTQLLDSDVVDVAVSTKQVSTINHVLPAENGLMFFSDQTQFSLNVDQLLTPSTVSVDVVTSYEMNPVVKPISIGPDVYFVTETGNFSRIREYTLGDGDNLETDATDVTAHVAKYLPKGVFRLAGSSNEDTLVLISDETGYKNRIYVYKFFYSGGEKVQSSWSYWEFADDDVIKDVEILNNNLYMIVERSDGTYLEKINMQSTTFPLALTFDVLLDKRHLFTGGQKSFDSTDTTFTLPYTVETAERTDFRLVEADGANAGRVLDPTTYVWLGATSLKIVGDYTSVEVLGGLNYTMTYTFSEQYHRNGDGTSITVGRYQLRTFNVVYEDYATFNTHVDPYGNGSGLTEDIVTAGSSDFTAKTIGASTAVLGVPTFEDGTYGFQIYGNSKDAVVKLTNDQPFNGSFVSCTVEGFFTNRGR